jgi:hypothetical protein
MSTNVARDNAPQRLRRGLTVVAATKMMHITTRTKYVLFMEEAKADKKS